MLKPKSHPVTRCARSRSLADLAREHDVPALVPANEVGFDGSHADRFAAAKVLTGTKVESIKEDGSQVTVAVSKDGKDGKVKADKVLQAIGFAPNVEGYGLDKAGVQLTDRKAIGIDEYMRTNVPHIYAIGDVTGLLQLAHVAAAQGVVAAETIGGAKTLPLGDYRMMPRATFCQPRWPASA